jgi:hypothetical protein
MNRTLTTLILGVALLLASGGSGNVRGEGISTLNCFLPE